MDSRFNWVPVQTGESGDLVFRRDDGLAYVKLAPAACSVNLAGERDRLLWLRERGITSPEVIDWHETEEGVRLTMTTVPGVPAADLTGADLLKAWPSMARQLGILHELAVSECPYDRGLLLMFDRAVDVVARGAVNPGFLSSKDKDVPACQLLAHITDELPVRLDQEAAERVVCHGDACTPNFIVDPRSLQCTGLIDVGRLGKADRYADLALMIANAGENWTTLAQAERAFGILFETLGISAPDRDRLAFYLRLDPLTWG
ncbi:TPA: APH(3'') family aminoglycoside O-phosphotransferase [Pseudomonas aeruginosa]|nr:MULTISPECIES: APH(3'') family aminoglycoside O-phosphotransferase [Pseudomonas]EJA3280421.1 APH(3'') family aminoglycoside O-phosphotransferase [Pseudomonas aeruginosa]ELM3832874.1 APH(3'') family aminoglycoside O-phosphotransferase [Pseudomonas aeruginosa]HCF6951040.1 APH(3'') family aminoglycoside O-phosphotransferase [Pseudomonas aeruginosa]HDQ4624023.1 APH(3'') family aminoglycoside O-phosphotransferase [Pseudomonas aeruginosa]